MLCMIRLRFVRNNFTLIRVYPWLSVIFPSRAKQKSMKSGTKYTRLNVGTIY
jgi:hypothetical protein